MGATITIENAVKRYGNDTIINGLSLEVRPGEFFTLLGPSGCGKTTLLRMIIGFNSIEGGTFKINDRVINNIPTNKRNIGMVFQNYAVFPHMNVFDNVAFGLRNRRLPKDEIERKVNSILKVVKIDHLKNRMPANLSGGQQQRVALARAIVIEPEVLLMDEPLSNLDAKLRVEMRNAIKRIQQQFGITTVYVTHDQEEALAVSDRIAVMDGGKCIQQVRGVRHFLSDKNDITSHPNYKYLSDSDPKNAFHIEKYLSRQLRLRLEEESQVWEIDVSDNPDEEEALLEELTDETQLTAAGYGGLL